MLLYDFFNDSLASPSDWRALAQTLDGSAAGPFDERSHAILQSEFKCLYVGITRAREHVWIWDSTLKGQPLEVPLSSMSAIQPQTERVL